MNPSDEAIRRILQENQVVALVGWSPNRERPSHGVAKYLSRRGYRVIPVNPGQAGTIAPWGETVRGTLSDIDERVDMIDIFRNAEAIPQIVDEALSMFPKPQVIWMQLGLWNEASAQKARDVGVEVVMNRCPAIEIPRLLG